MIRTMKQCGWLWLGLVLMGSCVPIITAKQKSQALVSYDLGIAAFEQGDMREALRLLRITIKTNPDLPEAHHALGLVYHALGKLNLAEQAYAQCLSLRPGFSEAHNNFGILLLDQGKFEQAKQQFDLALQDMLYRTPHVAEANLGWALYLMGDVEGARQHIGNATVSDPLFCRGYYWLAKIADGQQEQREILAQVKRFMKYCGPHSKVYDAVPTAYMQEMYYYYGKALLALGSPREASSWFRKCADGEAEQGIGYLCQQRLQAAAQ